MALHEILREALASLKLCGSLCGANHRNALQSLVGSEVVIHTLYQRILRTYNNHGNLIGKNELCYRIEIAHCDILILTHLLGTCVTWSNIQFLYLGALGNLPRQCVLTTTTT